MLLSMLFSLLFGATVATAPTRGSDPSPVPMMRVLEPTAAKAGDSVVVTGENLSLKSISAMYVSEGGHDRKVHITAQTETSLTFTVPVECKPGRYKIIVLLNSSEPVMLEEPVKLLVIE